MRKLSSNIKPLFNPLKYKEKQRIKKKANKIKSDDLSADININYTQLLNSLRAAKNNFAFFKEFIFFNILNAFLGEK